MGFGRLCWIVLCVGATCHCSESTSSKPINTFIDIVSPDPGVDILTDNPVLDREEPELPVINPGPCHGLEDGDVCDDQNACTDDDVCQGGFCMAGPSVACDTSTDTGCTVTSCNPKDGCVQKVAPDGSLCELPCYTEARCYDNTCSPVPGAELPCDPPTDPCVDSTLCDPETGTCSITLYKLACPDNTKCTMQQDGVLGCSEVFSTLCRPCNDHAECAKPSLPDVDGVCVSLGTKGSFCGVSCDDGSCPAGYSCTSTWEEGPDVQTTVSPDTTICLPDDDVCACDLSWVPLKLWTKCVKSNKFGECEGSRSCAVTGLTSCSAAIPKPESCDAVDNDCNGVTDDLPAVGCGPQGACCMEEGGCKELHDSSCQFLGGTFHGAGFNCKTAVCGGDTEAACCLPNKICQDMTYSNCNKAKGAYQGDGYSCQEVDCLAAPQYGACCKGDGTCFQHTALTCLKEGGHYWGDGISCSSVPCKSKGACCADNGTCSVLISKDCQTLSGSWSFGLTCDDVSCMPQPGNGACCLEDGDCIVSSPSSCQSLTGLYLDAEPCQGQCPTLPIGACCFQGQVCGLVEASDCPATATYMGVGSECTNDICLPADAGACCVPNNCFSNWSEEKCQGFGGEHKGKGSTCEVCNG
jgi:hypothetical protein